MENPVASVPIENHDAKNQKWPISDDFWFKEPTHSETAPFHTSSSASYPRVLFFFVESPAYGEK